MIDPWYSPGQIEKSFSISQIRWLFLLWQDLQKGLWPPNPDNSGWIDPNTGKRRARPNADFTRVAEVLAEIERRITRCGLDGFFLTQFYIVGKDYRVIAKVFNISVKEIRERMNTALKYISGEEAKKESYNKFKEVNSERYTG